MQYFLKRSLRFLKRSIWWYAHKNLFKRLGKKSYIYNPLNITPNCINCGKNVSIYKHCRIQGIYRYNSKSFCPEIIIEDNVSIQQNLHLTCGNLIKIGENTAIAANVTITDIHHPYEDIFTPIERQDIVVKAVKIGRNCKIYNNAVILPGCEIGDHVTIAANSVVTKNILNYSVAVGAPAKIVKRYNFDTHQWAMTNSDGSFINT